MSMSVVAIDSRIRPCARSWGESQVRRRVDDAGRAVATSRLHHPAHSAHRSNKTWVAASAECTL